MSRRSAHSSVVPEVPQSIKRMTIGEYNELVVPLAFSTLIENYEEENPEGEVQDEVADELSSKGFNSDGEAEGEDDWLSEPAAPAAGYNSRNQGLSAMNLLSSNMSSNGNLLSSLAGTVRCTALIQFAVIASLSHICFYAMICVSLQARCQATGTS